MALTLPKTVRHRMKGRSLDEDGDDEDHHDHLDQGCFGATKQCSTLETRSVRAGENFHSFTVEDWR